MEHPRRPRPAPSRYTACRERAVRLAASTTYQVSWSCEHPADFYQLMACDNTSSFLSLLSFTACCAHCSARHACRPPPPPPPPPPLSRCGGCPVRVFDVCGRPSYRKTLFCPSRRSKPKPEEKRGVDCRYTVESYVLNNYGYFCRFSQTCNEPAETGTPGIGIRGIGLSNLDIGPHPPKIETRPCSVFQNDKHILCGSPHETFSALQVKKRFRRWASIAPWRIIHESAE